MKNIFTMRFALAADLARATAGPAPALQTCEATDV